MKKDILNLSTLKGLLSLLMTIQLVVSPIILSMPEAAWAQTTETPEQAAARQAEEQRKAEEEALRQREAQVQGMNQDLQNQSNQAQQQTTITNPGTDTVGAVDNTSRVTASSTAGGSATTQADTAARDKNRFFLAGETVYDPNRRDNKNFGNYATHILAMCSAVWGMLATMACPITPSMLVWGLGSMAYIGMEIALASSYQKGANIDALVDKEGAFDQQTSNMLAAYKVTKRGERWAASKKNLITAIAVIAGVAMVLAILESVLCRVADATVIGRALLRKMCKCNASISLYNNDIEDNQNFDPIKQLFPKNFYAQRDPAQKHNFNIEQYVYAKNYNSMIGQDTQDVEAYVLMQEWLALGESKTSVDLETYQIISKQMPQKGHDLGKLFSLVVKNIWNEFSLLPQALAQTPTPVATATSSSTPLPSASTKVFCLNPDCSTKCYGDTCIKQFGAQAIYECLDADCNKSCQGLGCKDEKSQSTVNVNGTNVTLPPGVDASQIPSNSTASTSSGTTGRDPASTTSTTGDNSTESNNTLNHQEIEARAEFQKTNLRNAAEEEKKKIMLSNLSQEEKEAKFAKIDEKLSIDLKKIEDGKKAELQALNSGPQLTESELRKNFNDAKTKLMSDFNKKMATITSNKSLSPEDKARQVGELKIQLKKELAALEGKFKDELVALKKSGRMPVAQVKDGSRGGTFMQKYLLYPLGIHNAKDVGFAIGFGIAVLAEYAVLVGEPEGRIILMAQMMTLFLRVRKIAEEQEGDFKRNADKYMTAIAQLDKLSDQEIDKTNNYSRDPSKDQTLTRREFKNRSRYDYIRSLKDSDFDGPSSCIAGKGRTFDENCSCKANDSCTKAEVPNPNTFSSLNIPKDVGFSDAVNSGTTMVNSLNSGDFKQAESTANEFSNKKALSDIKKMADDKLKELNKQRELAGKKALDVNGEANKLDSKLSTLSTQHLNSDSLKSMFGASAVTAPELAGSGGGRGSHGNGEEEKSSESTAANDGKGIYEEGKGDSAAANSKAMKKLDEEDDELADLKTGDANLGSNLLAEADKFGPLGNPDDPSNPKNAYNPKSPYFKGINGINQNPEEDIFGIISTRYTKSAYPTFMKKKEQNYELQELPQ